MNYLALGTILLSSMTSMTASTVINVVYYEMPPFIYRDVEKNTTTRRRNNLKGMLVDIASQARELCNIHMKFELDANTRQNFTNLLYDTEKSKPYGKSSWIWLSLLEYIPKKSLNKLGLASAHLFYSPGIEIVVHRDTIGIVAKMSKGVHACRFLFVIGIALALCFGVIIWFIVS